MYILAKVGYFRKPSSNNSNASSNRRHSRSNNADFMYIRAVGARSLARANNTLARSISPVSHSNLTAASHTGSLSGLALNASVKMLRDSSTAPASHFSLARTSQNISVRGNLSLAASNTSSRLAAVPCFRSRSTAWSHKVRLVGKAARPCASIARAVATALRDSAALASSAHVRCRSSSSTPRPTVHFTIAALVRGAPAASAASASLSH
mmetsp:Transcript_33941/g.62384  ORF Transcript_33941/g.62384 Transcript_33941/m.62384 type:complete len:209 (-) Transcript_33941:427-1053(-)